ncbi:unnamed protein product [Mytilus edulis]|uniref:EGF-like domain-containing protein n=1 Tax=Mytilus edulis TaxID=6550 RepID=A0A8S3S8G7_MYTED|nr:unnamed protein product [Mytilus edulis]
MLLKCAKLSQTNGATAAYGEACDGSTACTDTTTQECISDTCQCKTTYFRNHENTACEAKIAYDAACDTADSGQCTDANSECKDDGTRTTKCLCKTTHYDVSGTCTIRKNPDIACTATGQCVTNAECDVGGTDKCECNTGYTETPIDTPTMCSGVVKFASVSYMYVVPILLTMMSLLR